MHRQNNIAIFVIKSKLHSSISYIFHFGAINSKTIIVFMKPLTCLILFLDTLIQNFNILWKKNFKSHANRSLK